MKKKFILISAIVTGAVITISVLYFAFAAPPQAVVVRMVTYNPPDKNDMVATPLEQRHWTPDNIQLKLGVPNTIAVVSNDDIETHQFSIPAFNVTTPQIKPFNSYELTFTPTKAGTFQFIDPRPEESYSWIDYRGVQVNQTVNHSTEIGMIEVKP
ncbi:MAG: cupredoxin domain-containing protein [Thaumarchaeota archaeon]|nr:cupredoxin domain-containing protein [Nitrososphaerota archaeon]MCL5317364.1 cupredoxin domain-containing protein [Nitrososphaerota archaeon]